MTVSDDRAFLDRLQAGDSECAGAVTEHFRPKLVAVATGLLPKRLWRRADPEDVVQEGFESFWARVCTGAYSFASLAQVGGLLLAIVADKVRQTVREHGTACRDVSHEVPVDPAGTAVEPVDHHGDPFETAVASDLLAALEKRLSILEHLFVLLRRDGCTVTEIAEDCHWSPRFVSEALAHARRVRRNSKATLVYPAS